MVMILNAGRIVGDLRGGKEDMTEKRFMVDDAGTLIDMQTRNTYDYVTDIVELLNELNNENMELKLRLDICEKPLFSRRRLHEENQTLQKENNRIKQTIKEAYKTERTHIGRSVLKQVLEQME